MTDKKIVYDASKGFWQGLPARDLTQQEWDEVSPENQKKILDLGIYKIVNDKPFAHAPKNANAKGDV